MWDDKLIDWYGYDLRVPVYDADYTVKAGYKPPAAAILYYDYTPQSDWIYHLPWTSRST